MDVSIIIVNWNTADYVYSCVKSIVKETKDIDYEIIVIDNASYDGCEEIISKNFPATIFVQSDKNLGFAKANNLGALSAKASTLIFLNPDTEIVNNALDRMYQEFLTLKNPGAVNCRLLNSDGSIQTSCVQTIPTITNQLFDSELLRWLFPRSRLWGNYMLFSKVEKPVEVEALSGAFMMINKDLFFEIGCFSTDYFMYAEDLDLCYKIKKFNYKNYNLGYIDIFHHSGGSTKKERSSFSNVMIRESVWRFLKKSKSSTYGMIYRHLQTLISVIRLFILVVLLPIYLIKKRYIQWDTSVWKWFCILRWSIGLEKWIKEHNYNQK